MLYVHQIGWKTSAFLPIISVAQTNTLDFCCEITLRCVKPDLTEG